MHDWNSQTLLRLVMSHSDAINDLVIKEYCVGDDTLSFITGGKDNSLRFWDVNLEDPKQDSKVAVDSELKRVFYLKDQGHK